MRRVDPAYVLVHSLLLGPRSWAPVAQRLGAVVPSLLDIDPPLWPGIAARVVSRLPPGRVILVAHSNAGPLVPAIVDAAGDAVAGCVFVDARLPDRAGPTPAASPGRLEVLRGMATQGRLPPWTTWWEEDDVARLFPDPQTRAAVAAEQRRLPVSYYEQRFPVPAGWDHRPCRYLLFSSAYEGMAQQARDRGWPVDHLPGGHLHQLVDPDAVAARIVG